MNYYTYDEESYPDLELFVFKDYTTKEYHVFEYSPFRNDIPELIRFVSKPICLVGMNNKEYDDQKLYYVVTNPNESLEHYKDISNQIIDSQWGLFKEWEVKKVIDRSIDIQVLNNWGIYSAKTTSLKAFQFAIRENNIKDLPYPHWKKLNTRIKIDEVIKYCKHDVDTTEKGLDVSKPLIKYRQDYGKLIGLDLVGDSEVSMVKKVLAKRIAPLMGLDEYEFRKLRTYRDKIIVKDIIVEPGFEMDKHKQLHEYYNSKILYPTVQSTVNPDKKIIKLDNVINYIIQYDDGLKTKYGAGGIHGVNKAGVYAAADDHDLTDIDWSSFYPFLKYLYPDICQPAHFPKGVLGELLMEWFNERESKYPKETHWDLNYALKIFLNLTFGLGKSEYSPTYDAQCVLAVCINGMFKATKLSELIMLNGGQVLMQNTDGILIRTKKSDTQNILQIAKDYSTHIKIPVKFESVGTMYLNDVNNYLLADIDGKSLKEKGRFERYETIISHGAYHKDTGGKIIAEALSRYFLDKIPVEWTIHKCNNIHDFFFRVKGGSTYDLMESTVSDDNTESKVFVENTEYNDSDQVWRYDLVEQKIKQGMVTNKFHDTRLLRYYISTEGSTLTKQWKHGSRKGKNGIAFESVEANNPVTIMQSIRKSDIHDFKKNGERIVKPRPDGTVFERFPNLDRQYYIDKAYEIINKIEGSEII